LQKRWTLEIIYQSKINIETQENYGSLKKRLSKQGGNDIIKCIHLIEKNQVKPRPQDEEKVIFSKLINNKIKEIDWRNSAGEIKNKILGLAPKPAAFTIFKGKKMKILESEIWQETESANPGEIFSIVKGKGFLVGTGTTPLLVKIIKPSGKQKMSAFSYSLGHDVKNEKFGNVKK